MKKIRLQKTIRNQIIFPVGLFLIAFVSVFFLVDFAKTASTSTAAVAADWHIFAGSDSLISIPDSAFSKQVVMVTASLHSDSYILNYNLKTGDYEAVIKAPEKEGKYQMIIRAVYANGTYEQLEKVILVEPYGRLYAEKFKPWSWKEPTQIFTKEKIPVSGAAVALYAQNPVGAWVLWPANLYKQQNPQESGDNGEFVFVAPPGKYFLVVKSEGLVKYESGEFEVSENSVINSPIELRVLFPWRVLGVSLLIFGFVFFAGKKTFFNKK